MTDEIKENKLAIGIATLLLAILYLFLAVIRPHNFFISIDEGGKFLFLQSILKTGSLSAPILYPFRQFDPQAGFVPLFLRVAHGDQFYTWWTPGLALFSIPFYWLFGGVGIYLLPAIAGSIIAGLSGLISLRVFPGNTKFALYSILITGLATPVAFYSQVFWEHTISTAFLMGSLYLLLSSKKNRILSAGFMAGCLGALSVFFRTEIAIILLGFGAVLFFLERQQAFAFFFGFTLFFLIGMGVNYRITGFPLTPNLSVIAQTEPLNLLKNNGITGVAYFLFNFPRMYALEISASKLLWGLFFTAGAIVLPFVRRLNWLAIACYLGVIALCLSVLFSPIGYRAVHGMLILAPFLVFAAWFFADRGVYHISILPYLALGSLLLFLVVFAIKGWEAAGGLQWGPRYLLPFYPILVVPSLAVFSQSWRPFSKAFKTVLAGVYLFAVLVGVGFEIRGIASVHKLTNLASHTEPYMSQFSDKPALLSCDINTLIPSIYWNQPVFSILKSNLDAWMENAQRVGIGEFYQLSFDLCFLNNIDEIEQYRLQNPSGIKAELCSVAQYLADKDNYCQPIPVLAIDNQ